MKKKKNQNSTVTNTGTRLLFFSSILLFSSLLNASDPLQLAYFVGTHSSNGNAYVEVPKNNYYQPKYHFRGSYKTNWSYVGHGCKKTCWLDRWTGKALRCYIKC